MSGAMCHVITRLRSRNSECVKHRFWGGLGVSLYGPGAPKAPTGQGAGANSGAQKPPGTAGVAQPQCLGEAGRPAREEPPQTTELRPGSAAGARNDHEQSFNYSLKATCIFHVTMFQTIISIGVQPQDCAFEIHIWQD
jgi:hypothetical protein